MHATTASRINTAVKTVTIVANSATIIFAAAIIAMNRSIALIAIGSVDQYDARSCLCVCMMFRIFSLRAVSIKKGTLYGVLHE